MEKELTMTEDKQTRTWILKILGIVAFYRTVLAGWAIAVLGVYPISVNWAAPVFELYLRASVHSLLRIPIIQDWVIWPWYRWDAKWYLQIAADGYSKGGSTAFPPLYPVLIRFLGWFIGGNLMAAALIISLIALGIACALLFMEAREYFDTPVANRSVIYLLAFPTAFFLIGAYSESLFVMWVLLAWRCTRRKQWPWALGCAILAAMTRYQGIGLFIPLFYMWWRSPKPRSRWGPALLSVPLVPLIWSIYLQGCLHLDFPWQAHTEYFSQRWSWPWTGILGNIRVLLGYQTYSAGQGTLILDLILTLAALVLLVIGIKRLPLEYTLLNAALILPALMKVDTGGLLFSMSRLVLVLWPNFILLGILGGKKAVHWIYIITAMALQAISSAFFFLWYWVA